MKKRKKGFIQIVEVALAAFLIIIALPAMFSGLNVKLSWERSDLISAGNNIFSSLRASGNLTKILNETQQIIREIDKIRPANMKYSLLVEGTPKQRVLVGCVCDDSQTQYAKELLTPVFVNNRWLNFTVNKTDIDNLRQYDVILFIDYADWTNQKQKIQNYLTGSGIVAVQKATSNSAFMEIFNLTSAGGSASYQNFTKYLPQEDKIPKYFLGFGFDVSTPTSIENKKQGYWYIWENATQVNISSNKVEIQDVGTKSEGELFLLNAKTKNNALPDKNYLFKVKKIFSDVVVFQAMNTSFIFKDFLGLAEDKVRGKNILYGENPVSYSLMTINGTAPAAAVWVSDFPKSDEYSALVKSAVASLAEKFYIVSPQNVKKEAKVSTFLSLCCDMPEVIKLTLTLWYIF